MPRSLWGPLVTGRCQSSLVGRKKESADVIVDTLLSMLGALTHQAYNKYPDKKD